MNSSTRGRNGVQRSFDLLFPDSTETSLSSPEMATTTRKSLRNVVISPRSRREELYNKQSSRRRLVSTSRHATKENTRGTRRGSMEHNSSQQLGESFQRPSSPSARKRSNLRSQMDLSGSKSNVRMSGGHNSSNLSPRSRSPSHSRRYISSRDVSDLKNSSRGLIGRTSTGGDRRGKETKLESSRGTSNSTSRRSRSRSREKSRNRSKSRERLRSSRDVAVPRSPTREARGHSRERGHRDRSHKGNHNRHHHKKSERTSSPESKPVSSQPISTRATQPNSTRAVAGGFQPSLGDSKVSEDAWLHSFSRLDSSVPSKNRRKIADAISAAVDEPFNVLRLSPEQNGSTKKQSSNLRPLGVSPKTIRGPPVVKDTTTEEEEDYSQRPSLARGMSSFRGIAPSKLPQGSRMSPLLEEESLSPSRTTHRTGRILPFAPNTSSSPAYMLKKLTRKGKKDASNDRRNQVMNSLRHYLSQDSDQEMFVFRLQENGSKWLLVELKDADLDLDLSVAS